MYELAPLTHKHPPLDGQPQMHLPPEARRTQGWNTIDTTQIGYEMGLKEGVTLATASVVCLVGFPQNLVRILVFTGFGARSTHTMGRKIT